MADSPPKMNLASMDIAADRRAMLKQMFPSVFTETVSEAGELVESIDFEKLKAELGEFSDLFETRRERYGMDWPGKKDCLRLIQQPSVATLKPCREESVNFDETENLFIEGDNLEVLKLLQKSYYGKVKMIYIDPPYNTGKEFIYPDKYSESLETYLAYAGLVDDEGKKFATNTAAEGRFHTKWLNMMYPRLYLARNLLREDGVIWISIDDFEISNVRQICNEIFGEENFIATFIWEKRKTRENRKVFSFNHDFIICYAQEKEAFQSSRNMLPLTEEVLSRYKNPDNDPRGDWQSVSLNAQAGHGTAAQFYEIVTPSGRELSPPPGRCWSVTKDKLSDLITDQRIYFGEDGNNVPRLKVFKAEADLGLTPHTLWSAAEVGTTDSAKKDLNRIFGGKSVFDTPKPINLLKRMVHISSQPQDIIFDFFAGCAPLSEAIFTKNVNDNGGRNFVMVQLPEPCDKKSEAFKAGYKTIADIGKERIRRVIGKIKDEQAAKADEAKGDLFADQGEKPKLDLGFKVLKLDRSNFQIWDGSDPDASEEELTEQLEMYVDHIEPSATQEDILYELLLKAGFVPTEKIERLEMAGKAVFSIAEGGLLICLEDEITKELIEAIAEAEPMHFICLDKGFQGNDQLKANAVQTFSARNQGRDKAEQIVFRTV